MARTGVKLTAAEFIILWNNTVDVHEMARITGLSMTSLYARGRKFRKRGIKLRHKFSSVRSIEVLDELKELAESTTEVWDIDNELEKIKRKRSENELLQRTA